MNQENNNNNNTYQINNNNNNINNNDNNKYIIHFLWVTADQLISSGEILNAIKCLETLIIFNDNDNDENEIDYQILHKQIKKKEDKIKKKKIKLLEKNPNIIRFKMTPIEEAITRIKIAELLFNYTHNYNDSRFYLEKASLLLSVDQHHSAVSLDLQTKISSFLVDIFSYGNQINLIRQEIKKGLKFSKLLNSNEWIIYFLLKELYVQLKDINQIQSNQTSNNNNQLIQLNQTLNQILSIISDKLNNNSFLKVLFLTIKCHYSILYFDYQQVEHNLEFCINQISQMNYQFKNYLIQQQNNNNNNNNSNNNNNNNFNNNNDIPEFLNYLINGFKSNNSILQNRTLELKIRDSEYSFKQLKVYLNFIYIIYHIRIGSLKLIEQAIQDLEIDIKEMFNLITSKNQPQKDSPIKQQKQLQENQHQSTLIPIFYFPNSPQYLTCIYYILYSIYSRNLGELEKSKFCLEKSQQLIDNQIKFIYSSSESNVTPQQLKESRALIRLKFLVYENLFYIYLTEMNLDQAFQEIKNCVEIFQTYPTLFTNGYESTIHFISSLLLQSIKNYSLSKDHLNLALNKCSRFDTQIQCIIRLIFINLEIGEIDKASQLVKDYLSTLSTNPQLIIRCSTLFLDGVLMMVHSPEIAKNKFKECLNLSSSHIGNVQLTLNTLNQLAKLYLSLYQNKYSIPEPFKSNINTMLHSSLSFSSLLNDINSRACTLNILSNLIEDNQEINSSVFNSITTKINIISNFNNSFNKNQYLSDLLDLNKNKNLDISNNSNTNTENN